MRNRSKVLRVEPLEGRLAPATLVSPTRVTYQDADGDAVTVAVSRPVLTPGNVSAVFTFNAGGVGGDNSVPQQLRSINLTSLGAAAAGTSITVTAVPGPVPGGDGRAAVGQVDGTGIDLGRVTIDGDLGRIRAGDATTATTGLGGLAVHSLGRFGTGTGAPDLNIQVSGRLGFLTVQADVREAEIVVFGEPDGRVGRIFIGGSLIGGAANYGGRILATGDMGFVTIRGDVIGGAGDLSGMVRAWGRLAGVTLGGSVVGGAGYASGWISSERGMGLVTIGGDLVGGAGRQSGSVDAQPRLAGLRVGGSVLGGTGSESGHIQVDGNAGVIAIGGDLVGGSTGGADLFESGSIHAGRIARVTLGGSLVAGTNFGSIVFRNNGAIRAEDDLAAVVIGGSVVGNWTNPVFITARGRAAPSATADVAIGRLRVLGRVEYALIWAGVDGLNDRRNADAQIGRVFVGGDWVASSLAAGASPGPGGAFGDGDDAPMSGPDVKDEPGIVSRITGLTIAGQAQGTTGEYFGPFGIVAQHVGAVSVDGIRLALSPGRGNDDVLVGATGDFKVNEV